MKLEPKHIVPYLPYELKIDVSYYREDGEDKTETVSYIDHKLNAYVDYGVNVGAYSKNIISEFDLYHAKPILRPLSDLNRSEFNYYRNIIIQHTSNKTFKSIVSGGYGVNSIPYEVILQLLEKHFDIYGLIEKQLAIDINTLES